MQKTVGVQLLNPLAVLDIGFSTGDILDFTSIDQQDIKAVFDEDFKERYPIDTSGFHGNGVMWQSLSHCARDSKLRVKVPKTRTNCSSRSSGTATYIWLSPTSIPAALS